MVNIDYTGFVPEEDFVHVFVNKFTDETALEFQEKVDEAQTTGQPLVPVTISSNGGLINAAVQMKKAIDRSSVPVLTYVPDRAYSCGFFLLAFGTKGYRFVSPESFTMAHQITSGALGKGNEIENKVEFKRRKFAAFYKMLDEACGKEAGYFENLWQETSNLNQYYDAQQTLDIGAADQISDPVLKSGVRWTLQR